jgi:hypothetical protein
MARRQILLPAGNQLTFAVVRVTSVGDRAPPEAVVGIMAIDLGGLPAVERAKCCREVAKDALQKASVATDSRKRAEYLARASGWHTLAVEAER